MIADSTLTREGWLGLLTDLLRPLFETSEMPLPPHIHVSVGWPSKNARSVTNRRIGECWEPTLSKDGSHHIFISPILEDPHDVAHVLVHELLHAAVGVEHGHKKPFKKGMKKVGLEGKATSTHAGPELTATIKGLLATLPPYPHPPLVIPENMRQKQTTRMKLLKAPEDCCSYQVRTTQKWIEVGVPLCPHGSPMKVQDGGD